MQVSDLFLESPFRVFSDSLKSGGIIKVLCVPSGAKTYSNTALKKGDIYNEAIKSGAKGLPFLKVLDTGKKNHFSPLSLSPFIKVKMLWFHCIMTCVLNFRQEVSREFQR